MKQTFFEILNFFASSPFTTYPAILICTFSSCLAIYHYSPKLISYYTKTHWNIIITFLGSLLGYIIYQSMHVFSAIEIQTLFQMPPNQLPHTLNFLTLILCIPVWLFVVGIFIKLIYLYLMLRDKKFKFYLYLGLNSIAVMLLGLSYKFAIKLTSSQELIRQMATYVDYVDKRYMPSSFAQQDEFDGFLIIDEKILSTYRKNNGITQFKTINQ